jgi:hypothetical protein
MKSFQQYSPHLLAHLQAAHPTAQSQKLAKEPASQHPEKEF